MRFDDLPPAVQRQIAAGKAETAVRAPARRPGGRQRRTGARWRCYGCREEFTAWTAAERHADQTHHPRLELILPGAPKICG